MADTAETGSGEPPETAPEGSNTRDTIHDSGATDPNSPVSEDDSSQLSPQERLEKQILRGDDVEAIQKLWEIEETHNALFEHRLATAPYIREQNVTPLMLAAALGRTKTAEFLIEQKVDVLALTDNGSTAFHFACQEDHLKIAECLLRDNKNLIDMRDGFRDTALTLASKFANEEVVVFLLDNGADLRAANKWGRTSLHEASIVGPLKIVELLAIKCPALLKAEDEDGAIPLTLACLNGKDTVIDALIAQGADMYWLDGDGDTLLHNATYNGYYETVKKLVEADTENRLIRAESKSGSFAFTIAVRNNHSKIAEYLLEELSAEPEILTKTITAKGQYSLTPFGKLCWDDNIVLLLKLLKLPPLFPSSPAEADRIVVLPEERHLVYFLLDSNFDEKIKPDSQSLTAVCYWAFLHGYEKLVAKCLAADQDLLGWKATGASWIHVAAMGGDVATLQFALGKKDTKLTVAADGNITPLHLAVRYEQVDMAIYILHLLEEMGDGLKSILERTRIENAENCSMANNETVISLAASRNGDGYKKIEDDLWKTLRRIIGSSGAANPPQLDLVMELAAEFELPRNEVNLRYFLDLLPRGNDCELDESNTLHLAVYHQRPMVVWWLLSHGGYLNEMDIKKALELVRDNGVVCQIIEELLMNPPPVQKHRAPRDEEDLPKIPPAPKQDNYPKGAIVDSYSDGELKFRLRPVSSLIYEDGPEKIMHFVQPDDLDSLKERVNFMKEYPGASFDSVNDHLANLKKRKGSKTAENRKKWKNDQVEFDLKQRSHDWRWIHIPVNDLRYAEHLMARISSDEGIVNKYHRYLAQFVKKSWAQLSAGRGKSYMKPQFKIMTRESNKATDESASVKSEDELITHKQHLGSESKIKDPEDNWMALYMPFVFWADWQENPQELVRTSKRDERSSAEIIYHDSMTLDQYYYVSLEDTDGRDKDQVLYRYMERAHEALRVKKDENDAKSANDKVKDKPAKTKSKGPPKTKILMVHQLWLWVINDKTVITSSTKEPDDATTSFFQRVLTALQSKDKGSHRSLSQFIELALVETTSLLNAREIGILKQNNSANPGSNQSPGENPEETRRNDPGTLRRNTDKPRKSDPDQTPGESLGRAEKDNSEPAHKIIKKSPLEVYRESILQVRNREADLFEEFRLSLDDNAKERKKKQRRNAEKQENKEKTPTKTEPAINPQLQKHPSRHSPQPNPGLQSRPPQRGTWIASLLPKLSHSSNETGQVNENDLEEGANVRDDPSQTPAPTGPTQDQQRDTNPEEGQQSQQPNNPYPNQTLTKTPETEYEENPYGNIKGETNLLREVKDIIEELNMLKNLTEDQEDVWKQIWPSPSPSGQGQGKNPIPLFTYETPTEIKEDIIEMINEAEYVRKSLDTLLDLKQKQANIQEALNTRTQSGTVMIFTVITIIFLPASFLTSLFALNVSEFPHINGDVEYQGRWIFPIIFCVSGGVSLIFSFIAFKWASLKDNSTNLWERLT